MKDIFLRVLKNIKDLIEAILKDILSRME